DVEHGGLRLKLSGNRQRVGAIVGHAHFVAEGREGRAEHLRGILVVVDDEDAPTPRRTRVGVLVGSRFAALRLSEGRQLDGEGAAPAGTAAPGAHGAAVQAHEALHEREPETETTRAAPTLRDAPRERLEDARSELGGDSRAVVRDVHSDASTGARGPYGDVPTPESVLRRVRQQIREYLREAVRVGAHDEPG